MGFVEFMTQIILVVVGMIYPGYQSFKAVKKEDVEKQKACLKYWLVLSVVSGLNLIVEPIVYDRIPVWPVWKIAVVIFLVYPNTKGYEKIYDVVLQPQLDKHEAVIDDTMDKGVKAIQDGVSKVGPQVQGHVQKAREAFDAKLNKKTT